MSPVAGMHWVRTWFRPRYVNSAGCVKATVYKSNGVWRTELLHTGLGDEWVHKKQAIASVERLFIQLNDYSNG